ncbi:type II toxin-antitoxin system VapC family toxin [Deltaproteobacteria bacterium TL4]
MKNKYLLDTHALVFWDSRTEISERFLQFLDEQERQGSLLVSTISLWEIGLLVKKERLKINGSVKQWYVELKENSDFEVVAPSAMESIEATLLPDHHKDPFDRLLIAQAQSLDAFLVTRDETIPKYNVKTFWMN